MKKELTDILYSFNHNDINIPSSIPYPCHYHPSELAQNAALDFQKSLEKQTNLHDFFNVGNSEFSGGKMFGILVVETASKGLKYLKAFSGKLGGKTKVDGFVPPIFDLQDPNNFFLNEEAEITAINNKIKELKEAPEYLESLNIREEAKQKKELEIQEKKAFNQKRKQARSIRRQNKDCDIQALNKESSMDDIEFKKLKKYWNKELLDIENKIKNFDDQIKELQRKRKTLSNALQIKMFDSYIIKNAKGEKTNMTEIFKKSHYKLPPSAAGECAAPKLFQYALLNNLKPIALAEFWWGAPSIESMRKHQQFYPACKSKCEPILEFMLQGLSIETNPLLKPLTEINIDILYEDKQLLIINKPSGLLSVPGKQDLPTVLDWAKVNYPEIKGPGLVHRLDMATSGILILCKDEDTYKIMQRQFLNKTIQKTYTAILDGEIEQKEGEINLPLRPDLEDRPRQMVCFEHGKKSITEFKVLDINNGKTRMEFSPITGRTHQLRVHSAHHLGLNTAIEGDELYGIVKDRLKLHASSIQFNHPDNKEIIQVDCPAPF